ARIGLLVDRLDRGGREERRPAAARVVLRLRREQLRPAPRAAVGARLERVVVLARERRLGALLAQHVVALRAQGRTPLGLCLLDPLAHRPSPGRVAVWRTTRRGTSQISRTRPSSTGSPPTSRRASDARRSA